MESLRPTATGIVLVEELWFVYVYHLARPALVHVMKNIRKFSILVVYDGDGQNDTTNVWDGGDQGSARARVEIINLKPVHVPEVIA